MIQQTKQYMLAISKAAIKETREETSTEPEKFWTVHRALHIINRALWAQKEIEAAESMDELMAIYDEYDIVFHRANPDEESQ